MPCLPRLFRGWPLLAPFWLRCDSLRWFHIPFLSLFGSFFCYFFVILLNSFLTDDTFTAWNRSRQELTLITMSYLRMFGRYQHLNSGLLLAIPEFDWICWEKRDLIGERNSVTFPDSFQIENFVPKYFVIVADCSRIITVHYNNWIDWVETITKFFPLTGYRTWNLLIQWFDLILCFFFLNFLNLIDLDNYLTDYS